MPLAPSVDSVPHAMTTWPDGYIWIWTLFASAAELPPKSHTPSHVTIVRFADSSCLIWPLPTIVGFMSCALRNDRCGSFSISAGVTFHVGLLPAASDTKPFEQTATPVAPGNEPTVNGTNCSVSSAFATMVGVPTEPTGRNDPPLVTR